MEEKYIIFCDGGSRGNPGPAASAIIVTSNNRVLYSEGKYLGVDTNNVAEYNAVLLAINWVVKNARHSLVIVNLDSQLVERQLNGFYQVRDIKLKKLHDEIKTITQKYNLKISFAWGYREKNKIADSLVNETLDNASSTGKQN